MRWLVLVCGPLLVAAVPSFDPTALLREALIPADAAVDSVIYRLRAFDTSFDYPLVFTLQEQQSAVAVETLNCTRFNSVCQANVVVRKRLDVGRYYDFTVEVRNQKGYSSRLHCSFLATNATTPYGEIFPGAPTLLMVSENARRNTELGTILAKGNLLAEKSVLLELWGTPQFGIRQRVVNEKDSEGTILLLGRLDYEKQTVHHLTVLANDPWTETDKDTRNIAGWPLLVSVLDEQDTPPIFTLAPPTTALDTNLQPGDVVLRVHAEDGDRGNPRDIRYGLVSEGNPFVTFFNMSESTGELRLVRPLADIQAISHSGSPVLLTVVAEEVRSNSQEPPSQSSTVQLALLPPGFTAGSPRFSSAEYSSNLNENSATGTILDIQSAEIITEPGDVVTLELVNNNGTFDISPSVVEGRSSFQLKVHDPRYLDYETRQSVECVLVAKEVGPGNFTATARLVVSLNDVNDNPPIFVKSEWHAEIPENSEIGTLVLQVEATDVDTGLGGAIRYTQLLGEGSQYFTINPTSGVITVADSKELDAEKSQTIEFLVEVADEDGSGQKTTSNVVIALIDINDEKPIFEKDLYEFILQPELTRFTVPAFVKAIDRDVSFPNNEVRYEMIEPATNLSLNPSTGELSVRPVWTKTDVTHLTVRAFDGGIPHLWSECQIHIYPPERKSRKMIFIVPGKNPDRNAIAETLRALTGAQVTIDEVRPYTGYIPGATEIGKGSDSDRSVVVATVNYTKDGVIDFANIQQILDKEHKDYRNTQIVKEIRTQEAGGLWWILILLLIIGLIIAAILILCCICEACPFYIPPRKRKVASAEITKLVVQGSGHGKESKSVQVAEWFGRKEAWTPEAAMIDTEADSLRRHEVERGSDRGEGRKILLKQQNVQQEQPRDQLYIREGNADILRLVTRGGGEPQRPITLVAEQPYLVDSGKDILMRRYIDQQQSEAARSQALLPNAVTKLQQEHELLEATLRQQNALLRQILLEREREMRLETQSLPAGTQTDNDAGTQTEPKYLRPSRRKVRSDNDASDFSDEDSERVRSKRRRKVNQKNGTVKRKINTPIQEESESNVDSFEKQNKATEMNQIRQTRTSVLRQRSNSINSSRSKSSRSAIRKEVLREIRDSLLKSEESDCDNNVPKDKKKQTDYSEDSLDDFTPRSEKTTTDSGKKPQRFHSETDLRLSPFRKKTEETKSHSQLDLNKPKTSKIPKSRKHTARYMEWYTKGNNASKPKRIDRMEENEPSDVKVVATKVSKKLVPETESAAVQKNVEPLSVTGPEHPLLQHSEHRFEVQYPARRPEEDVDSGIALTRPPMAQKKSVFTIAYDDMHTQQLRPDSATPPI